MIEDDFYTTKANPMNNIEDIKTLLDSVFYTALRGIKKILLKGIEDDKPNFTQLQLGLQGLNAPLDAYLVLRRIMEIRFQLERLY